MGRFVMSKRKNGKFQFNLKSGNSEVVLTSEGYKARSNCLNGIDSVRKNSQVETRYDLKSAKNGKFYFNLKASNCQIVATSEIYNEMSGRKNGVASVMKNAPGANVEE